MESVQTKSQNLKPHQAAFLTAVAVAAVAWFVVPVHLFLLPLQYLNTQTHELGHALATVLTGGSVQSIHVLSDGSGYTPVAGGSIVVIGSAGYLGASLLGAWLIAFSRTPERARIALMGLAGLLIASMIVWVRGDAVGVLSGFFWIGALLIAANRLQGRSILFVAQFIGVEQCLTSFQDLLTLLNLTAGTEAQSDATILQHATGVPAMFWALAWCAISLVLVAATLRSAWKSCPSGGG